MVKVLFGAVLVVVVVVLFGALLVVCSREIEAIEDE